MAALVTDEVHEELSSLPYVAPSHSLDDDDDDDDDISHQVCLV